MQNLMKPAGVLKSLGYSRFPTSLRCYRHMSSEPAKDTDVDTNVDVDVDIKYLGYNRDQFIHIAESASPFIKNMLEPFVVEMTPGSLVMKLPYKKDFIGNPVNRVLHGGVAAAMVDHVGGFAAMSSVQESNYLCSTVDLRIDYINPALPEDMICEAAVVSRNKRLIRADISCWNVEKTRLVATGRGLYMLYPSKVTLGDAMPEPED